ncbi:MAG TPA: NAD(P)H-dependent oxidoreductase [Acetobacteraceae bacterium]|jgi:NAD(P)H-dependent FMN reductase|nr:NAD(P)H-dependent oxidoreductase [Acetobacteraceae bacterium]
MSPRLNVIIASTRPGRVGPSVARWFHEFAAGQGKFDAHLVDLADFKLPLYDEPVHPARQQYQHAHTKAWAESVAAADAYVFVTPEYNYNPTPALVNALNYVYREWNYKPCGFVSYGGVSGGLRAVQTAKLLVTTLKMMPMMEGVALPMVASLLADDGAFRSNELIDKSAVTLHDELLRWTLGLKAMRESMA